MKSKKGISLIVLVITIIVMIILAGAIILTLNNSGIINKANEAVEKTDLAQVKHIAALKWAEAYLDDTVEDKEQYVLKELSEEGINTDKYDITVIKNGVDVELKEVVPSEWLENIVAIKDGVPIPKGFVASKATGENRKSSGLVIYEGTEAVTNDNVETARRTRNQYVWVPVASEDFTTKFVRQNFGFSNSIVNTLGAAGNWEVVLDQTTNMPLAEQDSSYMTIETMEGGITNTLTEVQAMYASVKEYEGFYIARYEAGIDAQRTSNNGVLETNVYSMMGKIPYTYIPWTKNNVMNEDTNGVVQVARSMYPVTNTDYGVVSTLTYGVQWDTVLQWWLDTNAVASVTNSTAYGNYKGHVINSSSDLNDGALVWNYIPNRTGSYVSSANVTYPKSSATTWILSTGALKAAKVNNIYDMAGNILEWTMEGVSGNSHIYRGGSSSTASLNVGGPVSFRLFNNPNTAYSSYGFRPCLYIKQ